MAHSRKLGLNANCSVVSYLLTDFCYFKAKLMFVVTNFKQLLTVYRYKIETVVKQNNLLYFELYCVFPASKHIRESFNKLCTEQLVLTNNPALIRVGFKIYLHKTTYKVCFSKRRKQNHFTKGM